MIESRLIGAIDHLKKKNVVGLGIGTKRIKGRDTGRLCLTFLVEKKVSEEELDKEDILPKKHRGIDTDVVESGKIEALHRVEQKTRTDKWRPSPCGVSIGHKNITAGTQGALIKTNNDELRILSNNHVLGNSNKGEEGDSILQPGPYDGGDPEKDVIAKLESYVPIEFFNSENCSLIEKMKGILNWIAKKVGSRWRYKTYMKWSKTPLNMIDAALAKPLKDSDVSPKQYKIGRVQGLNLNPKIGDALKKSGRTSGVTEGEIKLVGGIVRVGYGEGKTALFNDQIIATYMSRPGDSGSLVLDKDDRAIGLLFAGSEKTTIINNLDNVMRELNIKEVL